MGAGWWGLLAGYTAADGIEFQAGILGGFYGATDGFADEAGDFDAALFDVEDYGAARWECAFLGRHRLWRGLRRACRCRRQWLAYRGLDYVRCGSGWRRSIRRRLDVRSRLRLRSIGQRAGHFCGFEGLAGMIGSVVA